MGPSRTGRRRTFWFPYKTDFLNYGRGGQSGVPTYSRGYIKSSNCPPNSSATWECDMAACNKESGPAPYYSTKPCTSTHNRWAPGQYLRFPSPPAHMYLAVKRNYAFNFAAKNKAWNTAHGGSLGMKDLRAQDAAITGHTVHAVNQMGGTSYGRTAYWYDGTAGQQGVQYEPQYMRESTWLTMELNFKGNTPGVADGLYKLIEQARLVHDPYPTHIGYNYGSMPNHPAVPVGGAGLQIWALDHLNSYHDPAVLSPMNVYVDYLYMDDSWCHVLISDETSYQDISNLNPTGTGNPRGQNWAAAMDHLREPQIIQTWSDTGISFTCRRGSHASLVGKYMYVVNDAGTVLKVGRFA